MKLVRYVMRGDALTRALVGVGLAVAAMTLVGLITESRAFLLNLLAGLVGVGVGVILAVTLVNVLVERQRRLRWELVREQTLHSIFTNAVDMAINLLMTTPADYLMDGDVALRHYEALNPDNPRDPAIADALGQLARFVRQHETALAEYEDEVGFVKDADRRTRSFYNEVRHELTILRDVLTPRVLELGDDPRLAALLFEVERSERQWRHSLWLIENDWGMNEEYAWRSVAALLDALADVAAYVTSIYPAKSAHPVPPTSHYWGERRS